MATQIGIVKAIFGEVTATAADGSIRTLHAGDRVFANELISTGAAGAIEIEFADGSVMDLGRNSQAMLNSEVFDPSASAVADAPADEVPDDVAAIQQAILEGEDPTEAGEATAAGAGVEGSDGGHDAVFVDYLNPEVTPDAGFDTVGVTNEYDLPEEDIIILDEEEEALPTLTINDVTVIEPSGQGGSTGSGGQSGGTGGGIFITGHDSDEHSNGEYMSAGLDYLLFGQAVTPVERAGKTVAIIGDGSQNSFVSELEAQGWTVTYYTDGDPDILDAFNADAVMVESGADTSLHDQLLALTDDFTAYINGGGSLYINTDEAFGQSWYDFVPNFGTTTNNTISTSGAFTATAEGQSIGLTEAIVDADITHSYYTGVDTNLFTVFETFNETGDPVAFGSNNITIGDGGFETGNSTFAEFTVSLSQVSDVDVVVNFVTADGTAISGGLGVGENDYGSTSGTLTIPAGSLTGTIQIEIFGDNVTEITEQYFVTLSDPQNATIADDTGIGTILDNDAIDFSISSTPTISEDNEETATFTVNMDGTLAAGVTASVQLDLGAGTATDSVDYDAFEAAIVAAATGETGVSYNAATNTLTFDSTSDGSFNFTVDAINDQLVEGTETIIGVLSNASVAGGSGVATISVPSTTTNITESDAAVSFDVSVASETDEAGTQVAGISEENDADDTGTFTFSIGGDALTGSNTATVTITASGLAEDADFEGMTGNDYADIIAAIKAAALAANLTVTNDDADSLEVTWAAGDATSFNVDLTAFDDDVLDSPEGLTLTLSAPSIDNGPTPTMTNTAATLNITDLDAEPTAGAVSALVDDDGLTDGIPGGTGDDTPDTDPDNDESTYSGTLTFDFGDNGAGSIDFAEMHGDTGSLGTENIEYSWDDSTDTLTAKVTSGDRINTDLFTVTVNPATGAYTVTLLTNVLHDSLDGLASDDTENNDSVSLTYTVRDSDTDTADGTLTIDFDDDTPTIESVRTGAMVNQAGTSFTDDVNIEYGADGFGDASLSGTFVDDGGTLYWTNSSNEKLTADGVELLYVVNLDGSLSAVTDNVAAETIFTVTYDQGTGTYTVNQIGELDGAANVITIGLTGGYGGGNVGEPAYFPSAEANPDGTFIDGSVMVVATTTNGETVNFNNNGLGVSQGSKINTDPTPDDLTNNEVLILNLTEGEDWQESGQDIVLNDDNTDVDGFADKKYTTTATLSFWNLSDGEEPLVQLWDSDTDTLIDTITYADAGDTLTVNPDGSWTFTSDTAFDQVKVYDISEDVGGNNGFGVSQIVITEEGEGFNNQIGLSIDAEDGDGDAVTDDWTFTFSADAVVNGTSGDDKLQGNGEPDTLVGGEGNDILDGREGADILIGGLGDDILTGGTGADEFVWLDGDMGTDEVTDFSTGEGDVLNLADLLDPDTTLDIGGADSLDDYLTANFDGVSNTTTINVYTDGSAQGAENLTQSIVVNGDQTNLQALIDSGNLNVDQS